MTKERLEKIYNIVTNQGLFVSNAYEVGTNVKVDFVCPHHPEYIQTVLEGKDRKFAPYVAPPQGLYLWKVYYNEEKEAI